MIPVNQSITGVSFTVGDKLNKTYYIPLDHKDSPNWSRSSFKELIREILNGESIAHNLAFELCLTTADLNIALEEMHYYQLYDTSDMAAQVNENLPRGLKGLSKRYLKYQQDSYKDTLIKAGANNMRELSVEDVLKYGCDDSSCTSKLASLFFARTAFEGTQKHRNSSVGLRLELLRTYIKGSHYDWDRLEENKKKDLDLIATQMPIIRHILEEIANSNTREILLQNSENYWKVESDNLLKLKLLQGVDREKAEKSILKKKAEFKIASKCLPYIAVEHPIKVTRTINFVNPILDKLGLPTLEKMTLWHMEEVLDAYRDIPFVEALFNARRGKEDPSWYPYEKEALKLTDVKPKVTYEGFEMNIGSPNQKAIMLYGILGAKIQRWGKPTGNRLKLRLDGAPSTDEGAFQLELNTRKTDTDYDRNCLKALKLLLPVLKANTRTSLYWNPHPNWKHLDGKVRPSFKLLSTRTRRPTGSSPNFLQLPQGDVVRGNIIAPKGEMFVPIDWSGEELRMLASESLCPDMLECFIGDNKKDMHSKTSAIIAPFMYKSLCPELLNEVEYEDIRGIKAQKYEQFTAWMAEGKETKRGKFATMVRKKRGKNINFLSQFLGTAYSAVSQLLIDMEEAEVLVDLQSKTYPRLSEWHSEVHQEINKRKLMYDAAHQCYHFGERGYKGYPLSILRKAINNYSQGLGSAVLAETGERFHRRELFKKYGAKIWFPIYDEIVVSLPYGDVERFYEGIQAVCDCMRQTPKGHKVSQIPEVELCLPDKDGISRWNVNSVELPIDFTLEDIKSKLNNNTKEK